MNSAHERVDADCVSHQLYRTDGTAGVNGDVVDVAEHANFPSGPRRRSARPWPEAYLRTCVMHKIAEALREYCGQVLQRGRNRAADCLGRRRGKRTRHGPSSVRDGSLMALPTVL
ncbi:MAG: hypothetical protein JWN52_4198 [Actinomycetia bacterium]|nr:hypothetical protein [Actinomycetes bacterium]